MPLEWSVCGIFAKNIVNNHINIVMKNRVLKRVVFGLLFVVMAFNATAQQIIVTKNKEQIKAKIIEISDTQVKYRIYGSTDDTPVLTMTASEIMSILFEDGSVYTFDTPTQQNVYQQPKQNETAEIPKWTDTVEEEYTVNLNTGKTLVFKTGVPIETHRGYCFYGEEKLSFKDYEDFLRQLCPDAYDEYRRSKKYGNWGITFVIGSLGFMGWSIYDVIKMEIFLSGDEHELERRDVMLKKCLPHLGIGLGMCLIGIPLFNKSLKLTEHSFAIFNQNCAWKPIKKQSELSFSISTSKMEMSLKF